MLFFHICFTFKTIILVYMLDVIISFLICILNFMMSQLLRFSQNIWHHHTYTLHNVCTHTHTHTYACSNSTAIVQSLKILTVRSPYDSMFSKYLTFLVIISRQIWWLHAIINISQAQQISRMLLQLWQPTRRTEHCPTLFSNKINTSKLLTVLLFISLRTQFVCRL